MRDAEDDYDDWRAAQDASEARAEERERMARDEVKAALSWIAPFIDGAIETIEPIDPEEYDDKDALIEALELLRFAAKGEG